MGRPRGPSSERTLRRDLVAEARRAIGTAGPRALTIRGVAKALRVSEGAPHFHFPGGVTELVAAVATQGYEELRQALEEAKGASRPDAVQRVALRYVRFGVENPGLYRAMFSDLFHEALERLDAEDGPGTRGYRTFQALRESRMRASQAIVSPLEDLARAGKLPPTDPWDSGLAVAALVHGLVVEFIDEGLGRRAGGEVPWSAAREMTARRVIEMLFHGLTEQREAV